MRNVDTNKEQLVGEPGSLRQRVAEIKEVEAGYRWPQEMQRFLSSAAEQSTDGIAILQDGVFKLVNSALVRMSGYHRKELLGMPFIRLLTPEYQNFVMARYQDILAGKGVPSTLRAQAVTKEGKVLDIEISAALTHHEGHAAGVVIIGDITDRKCMGKRGAVTRVGVEASELLDALPFYVLLVDADHHIVFANKAVSTALGLDSEHIVGRYCPKLVHGLDRPFPGCPLEEAVEKGNVTVERELYDPVSGRWAKSAVYPTGLRTEEGQVVFIHFAQDITEHKQAEEELQESEERYRSIVSLGAQVGEAVVMLQDTEQGSAIHTFVNDEWPRVTGYSRKELHGMSVFDLVHPRDRDASLERHRRKMSGKTAPGLFEMSIIRKDGTEIPIELTSAYTTYKGKRANVAYIRDITERKHAEEKIKQAAEEWRITFDSIADLVSLHDNDFRLVRVNKAFANFFKMKPKELIGKTCYEVVHETNEPVLNCPLKKTLKTKKPVMAELFEPRLGIHYEVSTSPIFDEKGEVIRCVHITKDITERKQMEEQVITTSRLASIGQLASGIAHELNNPLTSVIGFSQLLMEGDVPNNIKEDLSVVYSEAQRAAGIVKNLLTFARKHTPVRQISQINSIIEDVLKLRAYEQKVNNIKVNTRFAPNLPEIMADYFQMQQVFLNIIINAENAMTEARNKGTLTITTERVNNVIRASFVDDGPGISEENLKHLFDPFFTTKEVGKGTGLGLSICHGIIAEHCGRIYTRSQLGKGATFIVELPVNSY